MVRLAIQKIQLGGVSEMKGFYQISLCLVTMTKRARSTRITLRIEVVGVEIQVVEPPTNFFWDRDRRGAEL